MRERERGGKRGRCGAGERGRHEEGGRGERRGGGPVSPLALAQYART